MKRIYNTGEKILTLDICQCYNMPRLYEMKVFHRLKNYIILLSNIKSSRFP